LRELVDQFACAHDQRANAGADQGAAQEDQTCGQATNRQGCGGKSRSPAPGHEGRKGCGIGGEAAEVVEHRRDGCTDRAGAARHVRQRIGHSFQGRCDRGCQTVGEAQPDQAQFGDGITGAFDLGGIAGADRHPEVAHFLRGLAQGGRVNPQKRQCRLVAEKV
jgi:hypothetical protein